MNKIALIKKLKENNISDRYFCLNGGLPYDKICLEKNEDKWEVYYSERGNKFDLKIFNTEEEACEYFYNWLISGLKADGILK